MKTNIVIFEENPEHLNVYRVPEAVVSAEVLESLTGLFFGCGDETEEDWQNFEKFCESVSEESMKSNGAEKLEFPLQPMPGESIYRVFMAM